MNFALDTVSQTVFASASCRVGYGVVRLNLGIESNGTALAGTQQAQVCGDATILSTDRRTIVVYNGADSLRIVDRSEPTNVRSVVQPWWLSDLIAITRSR